MADPEFTFNPEFVDKNQSSKLKETGFKSSGGFNRNRYATTKTIAAGSLDVAMMTSTITLMRVMLVKERAEEHSLYVATFFFLPVLLLLEVAMAIITVLLAFANMEDPNVRERVKKLNNALLILAIIVPVLNIFAVQFGEEFLKAGNPTRSLAAGGNSTE